MRFSRPLLIMGSVVLSAILAYAARDLAYRVLVLPIAYAAWQLGVVFRAVPELVWWTAIVVIIALVLGWQLVPVLKPTVRAGLPAPPPIGEVEAVAGWLQRSRRSTYFQWQLAHRLGRVSQKLFKLGGRDPEPRPPQDRLDAYFAAGMNNSFVDFPARRRILGRPRVTPLDVDLDEVVEFLESQTRTNRGGHGERL